MFWRGRWSNQSLSMGPLGHFDGDRDVDLLRAGCDCGKRESPAVESRVHSSRHLWVSLQ